MERKKPRNVDIARKAGVSNATVSRVMNGSCAVNEETYRKVVEAMGALGYETRLKEAALSQRGRKTMLIMCLPSIKNPFYDTVASGAQAAAHHFGYEVMIYSQMLDTKRVEMLTDLIPASRIAGLIVLEPLPREELDRLCAVTKVVQCCEYCEDSNVSYVSVDDRFATRTALEYLKSRGREKIAFVNGPLRYKYARHRQESYLSFLKENGLARNDEWIIQLCDVDAAIGRRGDHADALQGESARRDLCRVRRVCRGGDQERQGRRLNVPRDLMVVGFDNIDMSTITDPAITTINQPKFQLGYTACSLLVDQIANPCAESQHVLLETELVVWGSTLE